MTVWKYSIGGLQRKSMKFPKYEAKNRHGIYINRKNRNSPISQYPVNKRHRKKKWRKQKWKIY